MNLVDIIENAIWEGFEHADGVCVDRKMDIIDTGGFLEGFSMQQVAEHVIETLGLVVETKHLEDGWGGVVGPTDGPTRVVGKPATRVARAVGKWVVDPSPEQA